MGASKKVKLQKANWDELADALKSAAHAERLSILHHLCHCGCDQMMVKDIYDTLQLDQSSTSRHLGIMKKCGLLKREVKQGKTFYRLNTSNPTALCLIELLSHTIKASEP